MATRDPRVDAYVANSAVFARPILTGLGFWSLWGWYVAACALALLLGWALIAMGAGIAPTLIGLGWQFLVTAALFPFAFLLIERYEDADVRFR